MRNIVFYCLLLGLASAGCRSGPKNLPPAGAFQIQPAGPQAVPGQPQPQTVLVRGDVKNPVIPWTEDMNLAQALAAAEYRGIMDPHTILLFRQGQLTVIDARQLLRGKENPVLQPGDIIELRR